MSVDTLVPRMHNPATLLPGATEGIKKLTGATYAGGVPATTLALVHLRGSQINGCSACVDSGARHAEQPGETTQRLFAVAAWREAPYFSEAEQAALALTEAVTSLSHRADPMPDEVWGEAARDYDGRGLAALVLSIAVTNRFNRLNATTRQVAGAWS